MIRKKAAARKEVLTKVESAEAKTCTEPPTDLDA